MERFEVDMEYMQAMRAELRESRPGPDVPLPGSNVKLDDQLLWLGCVPAHVLWRGDSEEEFIAYTPELGMDRMGLPAGTRGEWIYDRAPINPDEPPLPIYPPLEPPPEQPQQALDDQGGPERQMGGERVPHRNRPSLKDERSALEALLAKVDADKRDGAIAKIRARRPELVTPELERKHKGA